MGDIKVVINGKECAAEKGEFLLDICERNGFVIPHLCHHESLRGQATCRICVVEVTEGGKKKVVTSCIYPVMREAVVETDTEDLRGMRNVLFRLLLAEVPGNETIKAMAAEYGAISEPRFAEDQGNKCIMCGLCVKACEELGCNAIATVNRGTTKKIATPYEEPSPECIGCGSCAFVCPTGCIEAEEEYGTRKIWGREFELLRCSVCGKYYITKAQFDYLNKKSEKPEETPVCKACKQRMTAAQMKGISEF